jgi:hypothetical protein
LNQELLNLVFVGRVAGLQLLCHAIESGQDELVEMGRGPAVTRELLVAPDRGELLHQLGRREQPDAKTSQQLGGPGIQSGDCRQLVLG